RASGDHGRRPVAFGGWRSRSRELDSSQERASHSKLADNGRGRGWNFHGGQRAAVDGDQPLPASTGLRSASSCPQRMRAFKLLVAMHGDLFGEHRSSAKRAAAMVGAPRGQRATSTGLRRSERRRGSRAAEHAGDQPPSSERRPRVLLPHERAAVAGLLLPLDQAAGCGSPSTGASCGIPFSLSRRAAARPASEHWRPPWGEQRGGFARAAGERGSPPLASTGRVLPLSCARRQPCTCGQWPRADRFPPAATSEHG
ncbi:hypothetical protein Dimus_010750, partial [Dionaea muscipula]